MAAPKPAAPKAKRRKRVKPPLRKLPALKKGRPSGFDPERTPDKAFNLALLGMTDAEMSVALDISEDTLNEWKNVHPAFSESLNEGRYTADGRVARSLYKRATGMALPAVKIFMPKDATTADEAIIVPYAEHHVPDTQAALRWLMNRQPQKWRERREIEVSGTLEHRIAQMSPDERMQRLRELQAKAGLILEGEATEIVDGED